MGEAHFSLEIQETGHSESSRASSIASTESIPSAEYQEMISKLKGSRAGLERKGSQNTRSVKHGKKSSRSRKRSSIELSPRILRPLSGSTSPARKRGVCLSKKNIQDLLLDRRCRI